MQERGEEKQIGENVQIPSSRLHSALLSKQTDAFYLALPFVRDRLSAPWAQKWLSNRADDCEEAESLMICGLLGETSKKRE